MIINSLQYILLSLVFIYFIYRRGLVFLQIAQQDEYSPTRLFKWYKTNKAFDRKATLVAIIAIITAVMFKFYFAINLLAIILLFTISFFEFNPLKEGKLKLNLTKRTNKILRCFIFINIVFILVGLIVHYRCVPIYFWIYGAILFQAVPFTLILALKTLLPFEEKLQKKYFEDAKKTFLNSNTFCIGITGSYGKTSIKSYLGEILQTSLGSTFWPPEGTNTPMGITRSIRENLCSGYKYSVIEMAAYRIGSIAKLCNLTPPKAAIISAIGNQHLERFGNIENTYKAKTELAKAVPNDGILVCNIDDPMVKRAGEEFKKATTIFYGFSDDPKNNCRASNVEINKEGTSFNLHWEGKTYKAFSKILGKHCVSNLLATFSMAVTLGARPEIVIAAIRNIPPVKNRLALEKRKGYQILNDSYNSNEKGFAYALEVLSSLKSSKKILMTPGTLELGDKQYELNKEIAKMASKICDHIIIVSDVNKEAYKSGVKNKEKLILVDYREEAFAKIEELKDEDTIVLIENDLIDTYETKYRF